MAGGGEDREKNWAGQGVTGAGSACWKGQYGEGGVEEVERRIGYE